MAAEREAAQDVDTGGVAPLHGHDLDEAGLGRGREHFVTLGEVADRGPAVVERHPGNEPPGRWWNRQSATGQSLSVSVNVNGPCV